MAKLPRLADVKRAAAALGATVEDTRDAHSHECRVEAPKGKFWNEGDVHEMLSTQPIPRGGRTMPTCWPGCPAG